MPHRRFRVAAAALVALLAAGGMAAAAELKLRVLARESKSGTRALVKVGADTNRPATLRVRVYAEPRQRIAGMYTVTCFGSLKVRRDKGGFAGRAPVTRTVELPFADPDRCFVSAQARLTGTGRITVLLLKTP